MVKKKKAKRAAKGKKPSKWPLQTQFMSKFRGLLRRSGGGGPAQRLWPPAGQLAGQSFADIAGVLNLLGNAYVSSTAPAAAAGSDIVAQTATLANQYPWPNKPVYATKQYGRRATTINLYEISCVVLMMLQAVNAGGPRSGGGGSGWPPSK